MSTAAVPLTRVGVRSRRLLPPLIVLVSTIAYAAMRAPVGEAIQRSAAGTCDRFGLRPDEWLCGMSSARATAAFVGGSLLLGAGIALPGVVLAATGRRASALIPLLGALIVATLGALLALRRGIPTELFGITDASGLVSGIPAGTFWRVHGGWAVAADAVLLALPAIATSSRVRASRPERVRPSRLGARLASLTVGSAVAAIWWSTSRLPMMDYVSVDVWGPPVVMVTFAALLGTDRRWWPWVLAPIAVLLSLGPSMAVLGTLGAWTAFTWFGSVLPLAAMGLAASFWHPLALRFSGLAQDHAPRSPTARRVRPTAALNAFGAGIMVVSILATRFDPLPVQLSESLPTYLGVRTLAEDVRARTNLYEAILAMESHRAANGTYAGFAAASGEKAVPALSWADGRPTDDLVVGVAAATDRRAQVVVSSESGAAFCLRSEAGILTLGRGDTLAGAVRTCGTVPWSSRELAIVDLDAVCGAASSSVILICRGAQQVIEDILSSPTV